MAGVNMARFRKGQVANPKGRPAGAKNRLPRDLVDRVLEIAADLDSKGKGLSACAEKDPVWFLSTFLKPLLPRNVELAASDLFPIQVTWMKGDDDA
jgi:hypothetical protein